MRHDAGGAPERGEDAGSFALSQPCGHGEHDSCSGYEDNDQRSNQELDGNHLNVALRLNVLSGAAATISSMRELQSVWPCSATQTPCGTTIPPDPSGRGQESWTR